MKQALWCWPTDRWLPAFVSLPDSFLWQSEPTVTELSRSDVPEGDALRLSVTAVGWCINTTAPCPLGGKLWGACPTLNPRVPKRRGLSDHSQQRLDAPFKACLPFPVSHPHSPIRCPGITSHLNHFTQILVLGSGSGATTKDLWKTSDSYLGSFFFFFFSIYLLAWGAARGVVIALHKVSSRDTLTQ